jgi:hypothetical protein
VQESIMLLKSLNITLLAVLVFLLPVDAVNAWGQVQYTVTDLGTLSGKSISCATGINDSGQVVG